MPVLPVASAILALSSGSYVVTRYGDSTYVAGAWTQGGSSTFTIQASVQPAPGQELQKLPEGERILDNLIVITPTELNTREGDNAPDRIAIDGAIYEVLTVKDWFSEGGFYQAMVRRVDA